jgi:integrase
VGKLYKRGDTYWAYYSPARGQYIRTTLRTNNRDVARDRLKELEKRGSFEPEEADPAPNGPQVGTTLAEAFTAYLDTIKVPATRDVYERKARHVERILGPGTDIGLITADDVEEYIEAREDEEAHPHTVYKELIVLRGAFKLFRRPTTDWPKHKPNYVPRKRYLTRPQFDGLMRLLDPRRQQWLAIACFSGLRFSELEGLTSRHVDWGLKVINVAGTKSKGARRVIPIKDELAPWLEKLPVHPWAASNVRRDLTSLIVKVDPSWPTHVNRNGDTVPEPLSPNDLRRTFASWMVQAGVPLLVVARLLGHTTTRMVEAVYGQLDLETMRRAVAAF